MKSYLHLEKDTLLFSFVVLKKKKIQPPGWAPHTHDSGNWVSELQLSPVLSHLP